MKTEILPAPSDADVLVYASDLAAAMTQKSSDPNCVLNVSITPWAMKRLVALAKRGRAMRT